MRILLVILIIFVMILLARNDLRKFQSWDRIRQSIYAIVRLKLKATLLTLQHPIKTPLPLGSFSLL